MKRNMLILLFLFGVTGIATYWFYTQSTITSKQVDINTDNQNTEVKQPVVAASTMTKDAAENNKAQDQQKKASDESLFELKSSIQDVIADSIQDEIQEAVENKIIKTDDVQQ